MYIEIRRREVLNNIIRFKDKLLEKREREQKSPLPRERVYLALVNRKTGDMRFSQNINTLERQFPPSGKGNLADWQEIHLVVVDIEDGIRFKFTDGKGIAIRPTEMDPLALRTLFEMLDVLNQLAALQRALPLGTLPEELALRNLSQIHISSGREAIESMPGWCGQLSRIDAEKKLLKCSAGSYLLRDADPIVESVARQFESTNKSPVRFYILTFMEEKKKIADVLLIHSEKGWTVCRDESNLHSSVYNYYPTLRELLQSLGEKITEPI